MGCYSKNTYIETQTIELQQKHVDCEYLDHGKFSIPIHKSTAELAWPVHAGPILPSRKVEIPFPTVHSESGWNVVYGTMLRQWEEEQVPQGSTGCVPPGAGSIGVEPGGWDFMGISLGCNGIQLANNMIAGDILALSENRGFTPANQFSCGFFSDKATCLENSWNIPM